MVKNRCNQSGHETLKLTVSKELIHEMNWFYLFFLHAGEN